MTCRMSEWDPCSCGCSRSRLGIVDLNGRLLTPSRTDAAPMVPTMSIGASGSIEAFRADIERRSAAGIGPIVKAGRPITAAEQAGSFLGGGVRDFLVGSGLVDPAGEPRAPSFPSFGLLLAGAAVILLLSRR